MRGLLGAGAGAQCTFPLVSREGWREYRTPTSRHTLEMQYIPTAAAHRRHGPAGGDPLGTRRSLQRIVVQRAPDLGERITRPSVGASGRKVNYPLTQEVSEPRMCG